MPQNLLRTNTLKVRMVNTDHFGLALGLKVVLAFGQAATNMDLISHGFKQRIAVFI